MGRHALGKLIAAAEHHLFGADLNAGVVAQREVIAPSQHAVDLHRREDAAPAPDRTAQQAGGQTRGISAGRSAGQDRAGARQAEIPAQVGGTKEGRVQSHGRAKPRFLAQGAGAVLICGQIKRRLGLEVAGDAFAPDHGDQLAHRRVRTPIDPLGPGVADLVDQRAQGQVQFPLQHGGRGDGAAHDRCAAIHDRDPVVARKLMGHEGAANPGADHNDVHIHWIVQAARGRAQARAVGPERASGAQVALGGRSLHPLILQMQPPGAALATTLPLGQGS